MISIYKITLVRNIYEYICKIMYKIGKQLIINKINEVGRLKFRIYMHSRASALNPLTPELNPSAQRCLPNFFNGNFNF
jgi:hypothetical protein